MNESERLYEAEKRIIAMGEDIMMLLNRVKRLEDYARIDLNVPMDQPLTKPPDDVKRRYAKQDADFEAWKQTSKRMDQYRPPDLAPPRTGVADSKK